MTGSYLVPMELPRLEAALRDANSATAEVRWVAALALGQEDGPRSGDAIAALALLAEDPVEEVRAQAVEGLAGQARAGHDVPLRALESALEDGADLVRMAGLDAVELFADDPAAAVLRLLDDGAPGVRIAAARMLADLRSEAAADRLAGVLRDPDEVVRLEAALALVQLGDPRGEQLAIEALGGDEAAATSAAFALGSLGRSEAVPALRGLAGGWLVSAALKAAAAAALARCDETEGLEAIRRMLSSRRGSIRMAALVALARLPVRGAAARVGELLDQDRPLEVSSALRTLVALGEVDPRAARAEIERRRAAFTGELADEADEALAALAEEGS